jgi:hypothetical protein
MALVADEGLALFCGLNAMPKKSFLSEYSSLITPHKVSRLLGLWHDQVTGEALVTGESLNLDFHSVPYFGEHFGTVFDGRPPLDFGCSCS